MNDEKDEPDIIFYPDIDIEMNTSNLTRIQDRFSSWVIWICMIILLFFLILSFIELRGMRWIAVHKAKNPANIQTGCLYYEGTGIRSNILFTLKAPNDPHLPKRQSAQTFFDVYEFPIYKSLKQRPLKMKFGFCNPVQFVGVDLGFSQNYYIYDLHMEK